jgi:hypothetical protein
MIAPIPTISDRRTPDRQLTVLSCELLLEAMTGIDGIEPEERHDIVGAYHRHVGTTAGRFNGFVVRRIGQTVLVYFGYPMAHEDDAKRAVCATYAQPSALSRPNAGASCFAGADCDWRRLTGSHSSEASIFDAAAKPGPAASLDREPRFGCHRRDHAQSRRFMYRDLGLSELVCHPAPGSAGPVTGAHVRSRTE